ncbi:MAG: molybdopterin-binding protein [Alphaproteobacteria bacterium]
MNESSQSEITAAVIVIGNEVLSGRTKDANLPFLAERLNQLGIRLREARIVADVEDAIAEAVNQCRDRFDYVFTTGGIGPTHDDITSASVAKAFGVPVKPHPEAVARLERHYPTGEFNQARQRMTLIPEGGTLIDNPVSAAPGFQIGNVFVMAGVPTIMQVMFEGLTHRLVGGAPLLSRTVRTTLSEGMLAAGLGELQERSPDVEIGSYPSFTRREPGLRIVLRSVDPKRLDAAVAGLIDLVQSLGGEAGEIDITSR